MIFFASLYSLSLNNHFSLFAFFFWIFSFLNRSIFCIFFWVFLESNCLFDGPLLMLYVWTCSYVKIFSFKTRPLIELMKSIPLSLGTTNLYLELPWVNHTSKFGSMLSESMFFSYSFIKSVFFCLLIDFLFSVDTC